MITLIRSKIIGTHAYLMWAFVIMVILSLGLPGVMQKSISSGPWVLKVNDQEIGYNSFIRTVNMLQVAGQKYGTSTQNRSAKELYAQAIDILIYTELLSQAAARAGMSVSPCFAASRMSDPRFIIPILARLQALQAYSWHTGIDMRALRTLLFDKGMSMADFEREIAITLNQEFIQQMIFIAGYAPAFEVENLYKQQHQNRSFQLLTLPLTGFVAQEQAAGVTKQALQAFFAQHKKSYSEPEKRSALVWEFTPASFAASITDQQIESYYAKHKDTEFVQDPVKIQVRRILLASDDKITAQALKTELVDHPELFESKARSLSLDKATSGQGGLLEPFARGAHDKEFDKKAFLLTPGQIAEITTKDGIELIQLVKRFDKSYKPLNMVRKDIINLLSLKQFHDAFELESKRIVRQDDRKALESFITNHKGVELSYEHVTRQSSLLAERFFTAQLDSPFTFVEDKKGYIILVTKIAPSFTPELSTIESRVTKDFFEHKAAQKMNALLQELKKQGSSLNMQSAATTYKGTVIQLDKINPQDKQMIDSYKNRGIALDKMLQLEKNGAMLISQTATHGYLARLDKISVEAPKADEKELHEVKTGLTDSLGQENMQTTLMGFIASARRNATIKQNDALLTT